MDGMDGMEELYLSIYLSIYLTRSGRDVGLVAVALIT